MFGCQFEWSDTCHGDKMLFKAPATQFKKLVLSFETLVQTSSFWCFCEKLFFLSLKVDISEGSIDFCGTGN